MFRIVPVLLLLFACGRPSRLVRVAPERTAYTLGEWVVVHVTNGTRDTVFNDQCGGSIGGLREEGQREQVSGMARECDDFGNSGWRRSSRSVPPGSTVPDSFWIAKRGAPGAWRVELLLRDARGRVLPDSARVSPWFTVRAPLAAKPAG